MDCLKNHISEHSHILAPLGALMVAVAAFRLLRSVWSGLRVFVLARILGLTIDLKKLGEWAVVTGSTDGIGKGYAFELARQGLNIFLISRSQEKLNDVAKEIEEKYKVKTRVLAVDFSGGAEIYDVIKKELGALNIGVLVNNVGMGYDHPEYYLDVKDEVIQRMLNVNMHSVAMMSKIVLVGMTERKKGAVINISSGAASFPIALLSAYSATKAFVDYFSDALKQEYESRGIIVQCVLPFFVATKLSKIRRSSFFIPDPYSYARAAVSTIGQQNKTYGCLSHALQGYVQGLAPRWLAEKVSISTMKGVRKAALKRAQKKQ